MGNDKKLIKFERRRKRKKSRQKFRKKIRNLVSSIKHNLSSFKSFIFQRETLFYFLMLTSSSTITKKLNKMNSQLQEFAYKRLIKKIVIQT